VTKFFLHSLGCPKNLVDSEKLLLRLQKEGHIHTSDAADSNIIIINTCGFIEDAKREAIEEILRLAEFKRGKNSKKLVVIGCLPERHGDILMKEMPEIDAIWGVGAEDRIVDYCRRYLSGHGKNRNVEVKELKSPYPVIAGTSSYAYIKIAEGCDRGCSYCIIPRIRGRYRSRPPDQILTEAEEYVRSGIRELILVGQDTTSYGREINGYSVSTLVREIASIEGDFWIRLLYFYPTGVDDKLIETISTEDKVCNYIDIPLQHSEERILRLMGRGGSRVYYENLITKIRDVIPGVNIRTTFIAGFPQETEGEFRRLEEFVGKMKFDRLGVFQYSREEGTTSYKLKGQVPKRIKRERYNKIMELQSAISLNKNKAIIGKTFKALVDEVDGNIAVARLYSQAPEIDGVVLLHDSNVEKGRFVNVRIEDAYDYDIKGKIV
jgi:ribosomal protein S12 methylthiotransferase